MEINTLVKLAGALLIVSGSALFGKSVGGIYKKRVEFLRDFQGRLDVLKNEIGFMRGVLSQCLQKAAEYEGASKCIFSETIDALEAMEAEEAWNEACEKALCRLYFSGEEEDAVKSLGRFLGASDTERQIENIEIVKDKISLFLNKAEEEKKKNEPFFKNAAPLAGVGIAILLF